MVVLFWCPSQEQQLSQTAKNQVLFRNKKESGRQIRTHAVCVAPVEVSGIIYNIARYKMFRSKSFFQFPS